MVFYLVQDFYCRLNFLDIGCMFLGQTMCIGGFKGFRVCL